MMFRKAFYLRMRTCKLLCLDVHIWSMGDWTIFKFSVTSRHVLLSIFVRTLIPKPNGMLTCLELRHRTLSGFFCPLSIRKMYNCLYIGE